MNETLWRATCRQYGLGTPSGAPQPVSGGLRHALYRAQAASGLYAVKMMRADVSRPHWRADAARGERLAQRMAGAGLPAVCALPGPDGPLWTWGETTLAVFAWRDGAVLPPGPASAEAAGQVGRLLARIHHLAPGAGDAASAAAHTQKAEWAEMVRQAASANIPWAAALAEALPDIVRWRRESQMALQRLAGSELFTHRDLDQKNVLWSDAQTPWLLDWEGAGPLPPALEVMGAALNWAGQAAGLPQEEPFLAFVRAYRQEALPPLFDGNALQQAARAVPDKWLVWLKFNMVRSLPGASQDIAASDMACGAVGHALHTLQAMDTQLPLRLAWCAQAWE